MKIETKPWGTTTLLKLTPNHQLSLIDVRAGGYSSRHLHFHKQNVFAVVSGCLIISQYTRELALVDETVLRAGDSISVPPGVVHRFYATEDTECFELYYAPHGGRVGLDDITRYDKNGLEETQDSNRPHDRTGT